MSKAQEFILLEGSLQDHFLGLRTKVQMYGGGFGNGKTTALVIKALQLAESYPGSTGLLSRATYPKLNDTLRKEFIKWCPPDWIKSFPTGQNASNICTLKNGTTIYFRFIAQQGKSNESSTSNLLSATYDWAVIDQVEDPEITHKDLLDLFGRLRGSARYIGDDPTMPRTGPRWIMLACNPTGNWVYTKVVRPLHIYNKTGQVTEELLCVRDIDAKPVLVDGKPQLLLSLVEGSTYELRHIHEADGGDFIQTQESMYTGQQRKRFLMGEWASYEGLVYPQYDIVSHTIRELEIEQYLDELRAGGYEPTWVEGYDYGQTSPSCYGLFMVCPHNQIIMVDGFYERDYIIDDQIDHITRIRNRWRGYATEFADIFADPAIFKSKVATRATVGKTISQMFEEGGIRMRRGNNDIANGIAKVGRYFTIKRTVPHPVTKVMGAPHLMFNQSLTFVNDEITSYYWKTSSSGERVDRPNDVNDHAMDMIKYALSKAPEVGRFFTPQDQQMPSWMSWHEVNTTASGRNHRHG